LAQGLPDRTALAGLAIHPAAGQALRFGPFRFDRANRVLTREGTELPLPPRALGVLEYLLERPGAVVSKPALMDAVWPDTVVTETSLTEAVSLVRQALADEAQQPVYVQTVHRRGYRFVAPVTVEAAGGRPVGLASSDPPPAAPRPGASARVMPWAVALAAVAVAAVSLARRPAPSAQRPTRFTVAWPTGDPLPLKAPATLALSPDGRTLAYTAGRGEKSQLLLRAFDRFEPATVPGTTYAAAPFFSPDGRWVGFFTEGHLKKAPVGGGGPLEICEASYPFGGSWGDGDTIVFAPSFRGGLMRVGAAGGAAVALTQLDAAGGEIAHLWPEVLPGGEAAVFTVWTSGGIGQARLAAVSLRSGGRLPLSEPGRGARYSPTGHLVFARHDGIVAAPFDAGRVRLTGPAVAVLSGVAMSAQVGLPHFALSREGTLAYVPGPAKAPPSSLAWTRPGGEAAPLPTPERPYMNADLAADGRRVAVTIHEDLRSDVWLADAERGTLVRLTYEGHNVEPVWSADGRHVTYAAGGRGPINLFSVPADGSGAPERLLQSPLSQYPNSWARDGSLLVFTELHPETGADLWALVRGGARPRPLLRTRFDEDLGALSPDGRWLAYESNESNRWEVYVRPFPAMSPRWAVSTGGGYAPVWSRDGRTLYYQSDGDRLLAVTVDDSPTFQASRPRVVARDAHAAWYGVAPDGRLLAIRQAGAPPEPIHVIAGWSAELGRN
jgi:eukaryotic-like serine/threonine-protein kinase